MNMPTNRKILRNIFAYLLFIIISLFPNYSLAEQFQAKVVGISDGDTIKVLKNGKQVKIRLAAIDCPEKSQPYGQAAKRFTSDMVAGKIVKVSEVDTDRYGRIIGFVFTDDVDLNKELLKAGLAWHYKRYSSDPVLASIEMQARAAKRGLWSEPNPVAPWEYRRMKK